MIRVFFKIILVPIALSAISACDSSPSDDDSYVTDLNDQMVVFRASSSTLQVDHSIQRIEFIFSGSPRALDPAEEFRAIYRINFFDNRSLSRKSLSQDTPYYGLHSDRLDRIMTEYQPIYLERVFSPPFDTVIVNPAGDSVSIPDVSTDYRLLLRDSEQQSAVIDELRRVEGLEHVHRPSMAVHRD